MINGRVSIDLPFLDILGHAVLWIILSIVTLGIGLFFLPYSFGKFVVNRTYLVDPDGRRIGRLQCELDVSSQIGHILIWLIISVITLGIGYIFYLYKVWGFVLNKTRVIAP
jgi:hypothetical protein